MGDMKKTKVKLMRQMRDEVARNKKMESKLNQQMESVLKENRKKEVALKRMKEEKKQRDLVLKRKQEEVQCIFVGNRDSKLKNVKLWLSYYVEKINFISLFYCVLKSSNIFPITNLLILLVW